DLGILPEDVLGAVAVVEVDVHDRHPAEGGQPPGGDGGVVEQAEAAVVAGAGVVAGRAAQRVGGRLGAGGPGGPGPGGVGGGPGAGAQVGRGQGGVGGGHGGGEAAGDQGGGGVEAEPAGPADPAARVAAPAPGPAARGEGGGGRG